MGAFYFEKLLDFRLRNVIIGVYFLQQEEEERKETAMKATHKNFLKRMNGLSISEIISLMDKTWDTPEGELFRECGFEIIDGRVSEEESDKIYSELWSKHQA